MDLRDVFASNLRRLRHGKNMSQEELAGRAGINRTYVSKLETGATYAGLEIIGKLADALKVDAAELLRRPSRSAPRDKSIVRKRSLMLSRSNLSSKILSEPLFRDATTRCGHTVPSATKHRQNFIG
jgi:transcriptional regulator with XRE-family HTH domain